MKVYFKTNELEQLYITPIDELRGKQKFSKEVIKTVSGKSQNINIY